MSEQVHPAVHPDADALSAMAEGALSEHERFACLAHLAECSRCREIVYLAQSAVAAGFASETPVVAPIAEAPIARAPIMAAPIRIPKRWFAPFPAFAAVAAALVLVALVAVYRQNRIVAPSPDLVASTRAPVEAPPVFETLKQPPAPESNPAKTASPAKPRVKREPVEAASPAVIPETPPAPPPPPAYVIPVNAPQPEQSLVARNSGTPVELSGITGTVIDPAGAVISQAQVNLVDGATGRAFTSTSDAGGHFNIAGLMPGRYELKITSPGFKQSSKQIDLQPQLVARADAMLQVGASSESVTITAEASLLKSESGDLAHNVTVNSLDSLPVLAADTQSIALLTLPDKLPPLASVAKDKLMLAADSTGALFLSKNAGKSWKPVKGRWPGKVIRLDVTKDPANTRNTLFQLTTDSSSIWLSRDGSQWNPAPVRK
jgi:hypothetical protein